MPEKRQISSADAILEATETVMARDPSVFVLGEGVADPKGIFGTTLGLVDKFGRNRVMEMPVSENGFSGMAIGAAMMGQRPIIIHQRVEFCLLAMEQLINNAAKQHYVSGGRHRVPLVVRLIVGRGWGQGPAHSQSLESLFAYIPGLKVVMPATARDAKGMLIAAVEDDNPVVMIEHRWIHYAVGQVPADYFTEPLDGPKTLRDGNDITVVASSFMTLEAMQAVDALAAVGCGVDLIDLRVIRPLNVEPILTSVRRTGRLLTVDTGFTTLGPGAEIVARVSERAWDALSTAPQRIGLPEHPTPSARALAAAFYPRSTDIATKIADMVGLPAEKLAAVRADLEARRGSQPHDTPNASFRGPF